MHQQLLKSLPKLTLLTFFCLSLGAISNSTSAQARDKSAVSPDIVIPSVEESSPSSDTSIPEAPAVDAVTTPTAPAQVEIHTPQPQSVKVDRVEAEPAVVEVQTEVRSRPNSPNSRVDARTNKPSVVSSPRTAPERVDIIMESRTSGCRSVVNNTSNVQSDLCAPRVYQSDYQAIATRPSFVYESPAGFRAEVRRLSPREIKAMSRPSNGDKRMQFPLAIPAFISSSFGYRTHPISGQVRFHQGTDIAAAEGTPVLAAYSGNVEVAGWFGGLGLAVVISHGDRHETRYGHMSEVLVKPGQYVKQGTVIGLVGSTGFSTGPHLHFELWEKMQGEWLAVDPTDRLTLALEELNRYLAQLIKPSAKV